MARHALLTLTGFALASANCSDASANNSTARWVTVGRDANYTVSIDTSRLTRSFIGDARVYVVWYRTDHAVPRLHEQKPFNREIVQSAVRCDSLWFKVQSVDMSMNDDPPISLQRTEPADMWDQPWRRVQLGTVEESAAQAACHFGKRRR